MEMRIKHAGHMGDTTGFRILGETGWFAVRIWAFDHGSFMLRDLIRQAMRCGMRSGEKAMPWGPGEQASFLHIYCSTTVVRDQASFRQLGRIP